MKRVEFWGSRARISGWIRLELVFHIGIYVEVCAFSGGYENDDVQQICPYDDNHYEDDTILRKVMTSMITITTTSLDCHCQVYDFFICGAVRHV